MGAVVDEGDAPWFDETGEGLSGVSVEEWGLVDANCVDGKGGKMWITDRGLSGTREGRFRWTQTVHGGGWGENGKKAVELRRNTYHFFDFLMRETVNVQLRSGLRKGGKLIRNDELW